MALVFHASYKNNIFLSAGERVIEIINQHRQTVNSPMTRGNIKLKSQINNRGLFRGSISTIEQRHAPQSSLRLITHKPESLNKHWAPAATHTHTHTWVEKSCGSVCGTRRPAFICDCTELGKHDIVYLWDFSKAKNILTKQRRMQFGLNKGLQVRIYRPLELR